MKLITIFLSLLLITTNAYAEWTLYSLDSKGNVRFYDKSSVKRNGDKVRVWMYLNVPPDDKESKSVNMASLRSLEEIDCVNETTKTLSFQTFTKQNLEGDSRDMTNPNPTIDYIVPESVSVTLMKLVCKK